MNFKTITLFIAIAIVAIACNNGNNQQVEQQQAFDAIMVVHDEVMPRIAEVNRLTTDLRTRAEALDSTQMAAKNEMYDAIQALERADEGMMSWMAEVQAPENLRGEGRNHEEIMRYLNDEQTKVNLVRDDINNSIQRAEALLQQAPAPAADTTAQQ